MLDALNQIFYNESLYGHSLTSLPSAAWNVATSEDLLFYQKPDPGTAETVCCLFEKYMAVERWPNGAIKRAEIATNILPLKYIEMIFRRVVGAICVAGLSITAAPVGLAVKAIHLLNLHMTNRCSSSHAQGFANCSDNS
ncbi:MAG: hypothetical protein JSR39_04430 [Verrucomicrobia bacterium]|nr:hypothetical protein [Verrucomicrobiota bacterium]